MRLVDVVWYNGDSEYQRDIYQVNATISYVGKLTSYQAIPAWKLCSRYSTSVHISLVIIRNSFCHQHTVALLSVC